MIKALKSDSVGSDVQKTIIKIVPKDYQVV